MYPVSDAFLTAIKQNTRRYYWTGKITTTGGAVYEFTQNDIVKGSGYISCQCCGNTEIELGTVYAAEMGISLFSDIDRYTLEDALVELFYHLRLADGTYEEVPMGIFEVSEANRTAHCLELKAYDYMLRFEKSFNGFETIGKPYDFIALCCKACSVEMAQTQEEIESLINGTQSFSIYTENDIETYRDFLLHDEPNPEMTSFVFRETLMTHLLLWGNGFAQIIRNGKGEVVALYPLMPDRMTVDRDDKGRLYYEYQVQDSDAHTMKQGTVRLSPYDVLHIPGLGFDGLVGYSPIAMAKNAIGLAISAEEYGSKFFANGATPGGLLEYPGTVKNPDAVRESWEKGFSQHNSHKIAVLEEGMKYTPISISPNEAQFLETRKFQIDEIARIFRVPPHLIGDLEHSTFSNIEQQSLEYVKYTLEPWLMRWEQAMARVLFIWSGLIY